MSVLQTILNIKVPYASEGVVRTAQLDDTVAPTNSVQLAVNMNFDRVGAIQTRPGVTSYADNLAAQINNFGKLHNSISTPAYNTIFQLGATKDIAVTFSTPSAVKVNETKIAVFWLGDSGHGKARLFDVNQFTGEITPIGTEFEFDATAGSNNRAILFDTNVVINVWTGAGGLGYAQSFDVSGDTIVAYSIPFNFDATRATDMSIVKANSGRALLFYSDNSSNGIAVVLAINPLTRIVSIPGSPLTFDSSTANSENTCCGLATLTNRFVNFSKTTGGGGIAQCFNVSGDTVTALSSPLAFSSNGSLGNALFVGDGVHVVNAYTGDTGHFIAQTFAVNASTGAVTTIGTPATIKLSGGLALNAVSFGDGLHFMTFYATTAGVGFGQMMAMDPSTFTLTMVGPILSGYDFQSQTSLCSADLSINTVIAVWGNASGIYGKGAMFQTLSHVTEGRWLYAGYSTKVANTPSPGGSWTDQRTGLTTVGKPRFAQYLNRIWMVNGNQNLGGDPVATSTGGTFGTDPVTNLVPVGFPKGDFISAGFEGRIWVVNKTLGIIYYTDIVQFSAEGVYSITYNADVNFITTLSPETGETMTALVQVPRALLVFTENTISRIYGATSVDAYPAYNVGTFSQESIATTKTGIFFHHSSGFYQFDYGSQPVEISRRIIDFVKAIPRANYHNITGVYDGFDNVEWSVGQVVVEDVVFTNCVMRYTISTQVWTIYDYVGNVITAMIFYDDGTNLNHLMGTSAGKTGAMDTGTTDFGQPFYYEFIDRWRAFTDMYYLTKSISGVSVYSENAAGANIVYQIQKSGPNVWLPVGTVDERNNAIMPNSDTEDFDVLRFRLVGNTKGAQVVIHGIEITQLTIKGQDSN